MVNRSVTILLLILTCLCSCKLRAPEGSKNLDEIPGNDFQNNIYIISKIVDGDTFKIFINGQERKVRLIGVDTPEASNNPKTRNDSERTGLDIESIMQMGKTASSFVQEYVIEGDSVRIEFDVQQYDRYNRLLGYVFLMDGRMINEILVREGYAQVMTVPPNMRYQELFLQAQREAREKQRGFWKNL